jgi:sulfatase modifying factor 1
MKMFVFITTLLLLQLQVNSQNITEMADIKGGTFVPLYGAKNSKVSIEPFQLDIYPVTNGQFVDFVKKYPKWRRDAVPGLFADGNYLSNWQSDNKHPLNISKDSPVNSISWYAAKAYCACQGKRLPTTDEWEYAAMADETRSDARVDSLFNMRILAGYETPRTNRKVVGSTFQNFWGIYDMHGLVWEWTLDFNSVLISGESRKDVDTDRNLFCASGAVGATDLMNYAAFMRYAFRGSVKANYSIRNLGFRCARDLISSEIID